MNRIKEIRENNAIKQIDLAKKLSVSQGTLSNWERGVHDPDNNSLILLTEIFNVTADYLLGKSNDSNPISNNVNSPISIKDFLAQYGIKKEGRADMLEEILDMMLRAEDKTEFADEFSKRNLPNVL